MGYSSVESWYYRALFLFRFLRLLTKSCILKKAQLRQNVFGYVVWSLIFIVSLHLGHWCLEMRPKELSASEQGRVAALDYHVADVFIGTSHVASSINPWLLPQPSGVLSTSFLDASGMAKVVRANLDILRRARRVFLEVDAEILLIRSATLSRHVDTQLAELGVVPSRSLVDWLMHFPASMKARFPLFFGAKWDSHFFLVLREIHHRNKLMAFYRGHIPSPKIYRPEKEPGAADDLSNIRIAAADETRLLNSQQYISESIELLARLGTQVILIRYPKHTAYTSSLPTAWELHYQQAISYLQNEARKKGPDLRVMDLTKLGNWDTPYFRDPDHLNSFGAMKVADIIKFGIF